MDDLHKAFPAVFSFKWSIGKNVEGRNLWVRKISDHVNIDGNEPEVYLDALIHAREPMSMECTLALMFWLAENYGKDPAATYLVNAAAYALSGYLSLGRRALLPGSTPRGAGRGLPLGQQAPDLLQGQCSAPEGEGGEEFDSLGRFFPQQAEGGQRAAASQ